MLRTKLLIVVISIFLMRPCWAEETSPLEPTERRSSLSADRIRDITIRHLESAPGADELTIRLGDITLTAREMAQEMRKGTLLGTRYFEALIERSAERAQSLPFRADLPASLPVMPRGYVPPLLRSWKPAPAYGPWFTPRDLERIFEAVSNTKGRSFINQEGHRELRVDLRRWPLPWIESRAQITLLSRNTDRGLQGDLVIEVINKRPKKYATYTQTTVTPDGSFRRFRTLHWDNLDFGDMVIPKGSDHGWFNKNGVHYPQRTWVTQFSVANLMRSKLVRIVELVK